MNDTRDMAYLAVESSLTKAEVVSDKADEMTLSHLTQDGADASSDLNTNGWNGSVVDAANPYALMRDCNASSRLTAQHYLWKDVLGFAVHPNIPTRAKDLKVADVATGNGIFLHDLSCTMPRSVELHGFDISLDQVGHKSWLPCNMRMHTWDMFKDPDPQFLGYFDIVHVRLVTVVVKNDDPRHILGNLTKLLKPGGYLQWGEVDTIGCSIKTIPGGKAESLEELFSQLRGRDTWKYNLTRVLNENGYVDSRLYVYEYGLDLARLWSDVYVSTWKEFADNVLKTPEASQELEKKAMVETRNGAAIIVPKLVWVARKAPAV